MEAKIQVSYRYLKTPSSFKLLCHSQHYFTKVSPLNLTKLLQRDPIVPINSTHSALIFYSNYCVLYFVFCLGLYLIPDVCLIRYSSFLERSYLHFFPSSKHWFPAPGLVDSFFFFFPAYCFAITSLQVKAPGLEFRSLKGQYSTPALIKARAVLSFQWG